jgi:hypothetical protein
MISRTIRLPNGSGPVYAVSAMPNNSTLLWFGFMLISSASFDNLRLYDLKISGSGSNTPKSNTSKGVKRAATALDDPIVPFTIVPGHHGGGISCLEVCGGW